MGLERYFETGWEVWRLNEKQDDYGGTYRDWDKLEEVRGRMRPMSGDFEVRSHRETVLATYRFYCVTTDIQAGDQIRKGSDAYDVEFAADVMTMGRLMQVDCVVVPTGCE